MTAAASWDWWAREDPLYAILSSDVKRGNRWELEEFMATGRVAVDQAFDEIQRLGLVPARDRALDFGCGIGRLSQALATCFKRVDGVDGSSEMIRLARAHNQNPDRVSFHASTTTLPFDDSAFDFVLSLLTLQHIRPAQQRRWLLEFARVTRPDGLILFQFVGFPAKLTRRLAAALPVPLLNMYRALRHGRNRIDMYLTDRAEVTRILETAGVAIREIRREPDHPAAYAASYSVVGQKAH